MSRREIRFLKNPRSSLRSCEDAWPLSWPAKRPQGVLRKKRRHLRLGVLFEAIGGSDRRSNTCSAAGQWLFENCSALGAEGNVNAVRTILLSQPLSLAVT